VGASSPVKYYWSMTGKAYIGNSFGMTYRRDKRFDWLPLVSGLSKKSHWPPSHTENDCKIQQAEQSVRGHRYK
jgi:hypothetical protein